jgi:CheY-like chemotaxis protein
MPPLLSLGGLRVLVVDDEAENLVAISETLRAYGADTVGALSVAEAIEKLRSNRPGVVVTDMAMPGEDGYRLLSRIRSLPPWEGGTIPCVALTVYAEPEERKRVLSSGFQAYLPKPCDGFALASVVARVVGRVAA